MARPGVTTALIFSAIASWNQFLVPLVLTNVRATPVSVYITSWVTYHGPDWGPLCASTLIVLLPVALFALLQQKRLVGGLTMGTVRGERA
jgi:multiple sugar transport system permease protein